MLLGCLAAPVLFLLQALVLFWFAIWHVQGRYTDLGFIDGGGAEGSQETFRLFALLLVSVVAAEVAVLGVVHLRRKGRSQRGRHQR